METTLQTGIKIGAKPSRPSVAHTIIRTITTRIAWLYDRFVFHIIYRGERLRPEVAERIEKSIKDAKNGKNVSPTFTNGEDAIKWLKSQKS